MEITKACDVAYQARFFAVNKQNTTAHVQKTATEQNYAEPAKLTMDMNQKGVKAAETVVGSISKDASRLDIYV